MQVIDPRRVPGEYGKELLMTEGAPENGGRRTPVEQPYCVNVITNEPSTEYSTPSFVPFARTASV